MAVTVLSASLLVSCVGACEGAGEAGGCDWVADVESIGLRRFRSSHLEHVDT